jgi:hypothetical protein
MARRIFFVHDIRYVLLLFRAADIRSRAGTGTRGGGAPDARVGQVSAKRQKPGHDTVHNVIVSNNETIILGGLIREAEKTLKNRVPGLSYIPIIGNFFTSRGNR